MPDLQFDPASFRDPEGRVVHFGGRVLRTLSPDALARMRRLIDDGVLQVWIDEGLVIRTWLAEPPQAMVEAEAVLEHQRIPVLTYPYEWSYAMLRRAAAVTLEIAVRATTKGYMLKDASAFNIAFHDGRMVLIDVPSIDAQRDAGIWEGYAQFCRELMYPLMLTAYKGIPFQPWLRGLPGGITAKDMRALLGAAGLRRRGVIKHVVLPTMLERSFADSDANIRKDLTARKLPPKVAEKLLGGLRSLVDSLPEEQAASHWSGYPESHSYDARDMDAKRRFVRETVERLGCRSLIDLGCNTGDFAFLLAPTLDRVVALDADPASIDAVWRRLCADDVHNVIPLVADVLNPSPGLGWALGERAPLYQRVRCDGFIALAFVHHVCITGNVPFDAFVELLAGLGAGGVVEWIDKADPMVATLMRSRRDVFADYTLEAFERALRRAFEIGPTLTMHGGTRRLYALQSRPPA